MSLFRGGAQQIGDAATMMAEQAIRSSSFGGPVVRQTPADLQMLAQLRADPAGMCNRAADAKARNSPAYPALAAQCAARRRALVLAGTYVPDGMTPDDAAYRVALTDAGEAVVAKQPALISQRAKIPMDPNGDAAQRRGFTIAQGVRNGLVDPGYLAWVVRAFASSPLLLKGFNDAINAPATIELDQQAAPAAESKGIPMPVLIAGGAVGVLGLAALAYKLSR